MILSVLLGAKCNMDRAPYESHSLHVQNLGRAEEMHPANTLEPTRGSGRGHEAGGALRGIRRARAFLRTAAKLRPLIGR